MERKIGFALFLLFILTASYTALTQWRQDQALTRSVLDVLEYSDPTYEDMKTVFEELRKMEDSFMSQLIAQEELENLDDRANEYLGALEGYYILLEGENDTLIDFAETESRERLITYTDLLLDLWDKVNFANRIVAIFTGVIFTGYTIMVRMNQRDR